ncbi:hypothetical protein KR018_008794 [Drosophila ironensis]|nr:hypothetical protein KR018_008794 [Drosophila ironensis]
MVGPQVVLLRLGLLLGVLAQVLAAFPAAAQDQGPHVLCSNDDVPVCAQSRANGMYFLFENECDLRKAQRSNLMGAPIDEVAPRLCFPNCDFGCSPRNQPVCGVSSQTGQRRTFRSRCEMVRSSCLSGAEWLLQQWGACPRDNTVHQSVQKTPQPVPCTAVYRPVCAMYAGVKSTFNNECLVNAENIKTQRNWRIVSDGLCGEDSTKMKQSRKLKPLAKPKLEADRTKRSHRPKNLLVSQTEEFQIPEDAVQIYAPSTFHTQFISQSGAMEKSYSVPARKPYVVTPPKSKTRKGYGNGNSKQQERSCVFGNAPVCGTFRGQRRTFTSVCDLMEYSQKVGSAWTIAHEGTCTQCDKPCPTVYQPVCATRDGLNHTIINECYLERVRCREPASSKFYWNILTFETTSNAIYPPAWKLVHKGECPQATESVTHRSVPKKMRFPPLVPRALYGKNKLQKSKTVQSPLWKPAFKTTTARSPAETKTLLTIAPSLQPNNRKIRKIEAASFSGFRGSPASRTNFLNHEEEPAWSTNDDWLVRQTLDNVKGYFSKEPASFKKAYPAKAPRDYSRIPASFSPRSSSTSTTRAAGTRNSRATTTEAGPPAHPHLPVFLSLASAELVNLGVSSKTAVFGDEHAQLLQMLTPQISTTSTTPVPSTTAAISTSDPASTEEETTGDTSPGSEVTIEMDTTTEPLHTTMAVPSSSTDSTTAAILTAPTEAEEEAQSQTTEAAREEATSTSTFAAAVQSADYAADEGPGESGGQTSIYGLDKNSLIMRLLRARSSQNVLI